MKAYRVLLLIIIGALSAIVGWALYMVMLFARYPVPLPSLSAEMWGLFLGIPAAVGAVTALFFPVWQRIFTIHSRPMRSILLWVVLAILLVAVQFLIIAPTDVFLGIFSIDFLLWILSAVVAGTCFHLLRVMTGETDEAEAVVLGKLRHTIGFRPRATHDTRAIALVFDLQGFAAFFNQPWAQNYVPRYLDLVFTAMSTELFGGKRFWGDRRTVRSLLHPAHQKFLGDGMLYVWTPPAGKDTFSDAFVSDLVKRLCSLTYEFPVINQACVGPIPSSFELPAQIRLGIARGNVHELTRKHSYAKEYIGYCINLASRLQDYCPELSLIASTRLKVPEETLKEADLIKVTASSIKGFSDEEVIVHRKEFEDLADERKKVLFHSVTAV